MGQNVMIVLGAKCDMCGTVIFIDEYTGYVDIPVVEAKASGFRVGKLDNMHYCNTCRRKHRLPEWYPNGENSHDDSFRN